MDTEPQKGTLITSKDVAEWMGSRVGSKDGPLTRRRGNQIAAKFGQEFTYLNRSGKRAIVDRVLIAFRKLTGDAVVYVQRKNLWRKRASGDRGRRRVRE